MSSSTADAPLRHRAAVRRAGALAAWSGMLLSTLGAAVSLGGIASLATPPLTDLGELAAWVSARTPVEAAFGILRVLVVVLAGYLLVVTSLGILFRLVRAGRLVTALDVCTLPTVRRLLQGGLGLGVVGVTVIGSAAGSVAPSAATQGAPTAHLTTFAGADGALASHAAGADPGAPTMERLEEVARPTATSTEVTLEAGDHLWSTAEQVLAAAWGRSPTDAEVAPFWDQLVAANRDRLLDPANPDLVVPGQVLVVPAPPLA